MWSAKTAREILLAAQQQQQLRLSLKETSAYLNNKMHKQNCGIGKYATNTHAHTLNGHSEHKQIHLFRLSFDTTCWEMHFHIRTHAHMRESSFFVEDTDISRTGEKKRKTLPFVQWKWQMRNKAKQNRKEAATMKRRAGASVSLRIRTHFLPFALSCWFLWASFCKHLLDEGKKFVSFPIRAKLCAHTPLATLARYNLCVFFTFLWNFGSFAFCCCYGHWHQWQNRIRWIYGRKKGTRSYLFAAEKCRVVSATLFVNRQWTAEFHVSQKKAAQIDLSIFIFRPESRGKRILVVVKRVRDTQREMAWLLPEDGDSSEQWQMIYIFIISIEHKFIWIFQLN